MWWRCLHRGARSIIERCGVSETYVHGYHGRENERLQDQAGTLVDLLYSDTAYPGESKVLEVAYATLPRMREMSRKRSSSSAGHAE
jgi:hypothetical protein